MKLLTNILVLVLFISFTQHLCAEDLDSTIYSCGIESKSEDSVTKISGIYTGEFENSMLVSEYGNCTVWLSGDLNKIYADIDGYTKDKRIKAYVVVTGKLSEPGSYGHFGVFEKEFILENVAEIQLLGEFSK